MKVNEYGCNCRLRVETASGDVRRPLSVCLSVYANISFYSIYLFISIFLSVTPFYLSVCQYKGYMF